MDYLKWWAGVCSWPPPLRWCPQPPPRGTALPSAARRPPLNGWLRPQTYWHESGFRWPDTRSDKDGHSGQNSFKRRRSTLWEYIAIAAVSEGLILPYTPGWCRSVGQREEGPMTHLWWCCCDSLSSTLSLAVVVRQVLVGDRKKRKYLDVVWGSRGNFLKKNVFLIMSKKDLSFVVQLLIFIQQARKQGTFHAKRGRWLLQHFLSISYLNGSLYNWKSAVS